MLSGVLVRRALPLIYVLASLLIIASSAAAPAAAPFDSPADNRLYHLAEQHDPEAQYLVGRKYYTGNNIEKNLAQAIKWFELAATQNHTKAQFQLGIIYMYGESNVQPNPAYALNYLRSAAKNNYAEAQYELGNYYLTEHAGNVNYTEAVKWYRAAADQQHIRAMVELGKILQEGRGDITPQPDEAKRLLSRAAEYGNADALQYLRETKRQTTSPRTEPSGGAFQAKLDDASAGHIPSQFEVGMAYLKGDGVEADVQQAAKWVRRAAMNDHAEAQFVLSHLYRDGIGLEKNFRRSLEWLKIAASAGLAEAQKELRSMDSSGGAIVALDNTEAQSGEVDVSQATAVADDIQIDLAQSLTVQDQAPNGEPDAAQIEKTADAKTNEAAGSKSSAPERQADSLDLSPTDSEEQFQLAQLYLLGNGVKEDDSRAAFWFEKAARQNHTQAQYELGEMYKHGLGVTASLAKAKYWLNSASKAGLDKATVSLRDLTAIPLPAESNMIKSSPENGRDTEKTTPPNDVSRASIRISDSDAVKEPEVAAVVAKTTLTKVGGAETASAEITPAQTATAKAAKPKTKATASESSAKPVTPSPKAAPDESANIERTSTRQNTERNSKVQASTASLNRTDLDVSGADPSIKPGATDEVHYLIEAANNNATNAQLRLAEMYLKGDGVDRDISLAIQWYQKAANLGEAEAQFQLGDMYKEGTGVEKNNALAIKWFRKAANQGHKEAKRRLGGCRIC